jgi:hypothetical protein
LPHVFSPVCSEASTQPSCKSPISAASDFNITNSAHGDEDYDKLMETLFAEIVTSPCTAQQTTAESCKESVTGSQSTGMTDSSENEIGSILRLVGMDEPCNRVVTEQTREGKEMDIETTDLCEYFAGDWTNEMEMKKMLDEMIAMTGLADGGEVEVGYPYATAGYTDIGADPGFGVDLDMSTLHSWNMDPAVIDVSAH